MAAQSLDTALGRTQGREPLSMPDSPDVLFDLATGEAGGDGSESVSMASAASPTFSEAVRGGAWAGNRQPAPSPSSSSSRVPTLPPIHGSTAAFGGSSRGMEPARNPVTSMGSTASSATQPGKKSGKSRRRQIVHVLEQVVLSWTRAIHRVLRREPEGENVPEGAPMLDVGLPPCCDRRRHPGPSFELDFWAGQVVRLDAIVEQLASPRARRVLQVLAKARSAYESSFGRLCAELIRSRDTARKISKLLEPLRPWAEQLEAASSTGQAEELLRPIVHIVQLAWKYGEGTYRRPLRVVVLFR